MTVNKSILVNTDGDIEGLDDTAGGGWGDYPLDSVFVRQETRTVSEVLKRITNERYILDPDFQRDFVWPEDKQSKLIESCLMRIPLPVFYVAEAKDGRIIIVDGLQRITTFARYVGNKFKLKGLESTNEGGSSYRLEGKYFKNLRINLQERILDTQLIMYILDAKAPERARLDIFERVNSGVPLSRQQMRNAIYNGPATKWLGNVAKSDLFRISTGNSLNPKTMRDREAINRFCAFTLLGWESYRGDMDDHLANTLEKMNEIQTSKINSLRESFDRALRSNRNLFGDHAFRKSLVASDRHVARKVLNISLFEVSTVLLAALAEDLTRESKIGQKIRRTFIDLLNDEQFSTAITYSTNSTNSVKTRFEVAKRELNVLDLFI